MKKKMYIISFIVLFFAIIGFQYKVEYDIRKQPPSDKWSKEVAISKGNITCFPKILKNDKNNIVAFNDGGKLQLVVTDDLGKKVMEKTFQTKDTLVKEVNLLKGQGEVYLSYNSYDNGANSLKIIKLDKELKELNRTKIENITETYQIGEDILIMGYKDKIQVLDMAKNSKMNFDIKGASLFSGVKTESGCMVTYFNGKDGFSYITIKDGVASLPKLAGVLNKSDSMTFMNTATSSDSKNGYLLIEYSVQGEIVGTRILEFALDGSSKNSSELYIGNNKNIYNVVGTNSKEGARFFATTDRIFGTKDRQQSIVDFILKDNKVASYSFASRLSGLTTYPAISGDTIAYASYNKEDEYGIYIGSQNERFKKANNIHLAVETKQTRLNTLQGLLYSFVYIIYPIKWSIPVIMLISIITFFSYSFSEKKKKLSFILISIVSFALKTSTVLSNSYGDNLYLLPQILSQKWVAVLVGVVISTICYSFGYKLYKKDLEAMPIGKFGIALVLDTTLTMMIFVPFFITF
ncbi:hypothetical protein G9F71_001290 [Clostridium sp. FP2]|uniref:hypothetical protein n=1 Tax=Clostridium TaxID=1485 RepID=UPI0013E93068|nr:MULTISPECIES: hypothetical protein [Clostridium]MBW9158373.1 hypothetical protein [Clostridium tagluense]MBZ9621504.1 hypothetical protein [Clostridium sp. FP2]WLC65862.1 hypothetical protein KTC93_00990 [Clostridium tagluense]